MVKDLRNWHFIKTPSNKGTCNDSIFLENDESYKNVCFPPHKSIVYCLYKRKYSHPEILEIDSKISFYDANNNCFYCIDSEKKLEVYAWHYLPITDFVKYKMDLHSYIQYLLKNMLFYGEMNLLNSSNISDIEKCSSFKILCFLSKYMNYDQYETFGFIVYQSLKMMQEPQNTSLGSCWYLSHLLCSINSYFLDLIGFVQERDAGKIKNIKDLCKKAFEDKEKLSILTRNLNIIRI